MKSPWNQISALWASLQQNVGNGGVLYAVGCADDRGQLLRGMYFDVKHLTPLGW